MFGFDENGLLSKIEYFRAFAIILRVLRPVYRTKEKESEIKQLIYEDWKRDSKGRMKLTKQTIWNSVFELVDIWTPNLEK